MKGLLHFICFLTQALLLALMVKIHHISFQKHFRTLSLLLQLITSSLMVLYETKVILHQIMEFDLPLVKPLL